MITAFHLEVGLIVVGSVVAYLHNRYHNIQLPFIKIYGWYFNHWEGIKADELGFHYIGTTLVGYTAQSKGLNNFEVLETLIKKCQVPILAEGNVDTPEKARKALEMGAYAVVVGSAITRP